MPLNAYGVLATFLASAGVIGSIVTWLVGPRRRAAAVLPVGASIVALDVVGHQMKGIGVGPTVNLFGFEVRLLFDLSVALVVSVAVALVQRAVLDARRPSTP